MNYHLVLVNDAFHETHVGLAETEMTFDEFLAACKEFDKTKPKLFDSAALRGFIKEKYNKSVTFINFKMLDWYSMEEVK